MERNLGQPQPRRPGEADPFAGAEGSERGIIAAIDQKLEHSQPRRPSETDRVADAIGIPDSGAHDSPPFGIYEASPSLINTLSPPSTLPSDCEHFLDGIGFWEKVQRRKVQRKKEHAQVNVNDAIRRLTETLAKSPPLTLQSSDDAYSLLIRKRVLKKADDKLRRMDRKREDRNREEALQQQREDRNREEALRQQREDDLRGTCKSCRERAEQRAAQSIELVEIEREVAAVAREQGQ